MMNPQQMNIDVTVALRSALAVAALSTAAT